MPLLLESPLVDEGAFEYLMPTVLRVGPYRLFYAGDRGEFPHVHLEHGDRAAKFWLDPVGVHRRSGFRGEEIRRIQRLVESHQEQLLRCWHEYSQS